MLPPSSVRDIPQRRWFRSSPPPIPAEAVIAIQEGHAIHRYGLQRPPTVPAVGGVRQPRVVVVERALLRMGGAALPSRAGVDEQELTEFTALRVGGAAVAAAATGDRASFGRRRSCRGPVPRCAPSHAGRPRTGDRSTRRCRCSGPPRGAAVGRVGQAERCVMPGPTVAGVHELERVDRLQTGGRAPPGGAAVGRPLHVRAVRPPAGQRIPEPFRGPGCGQGEDGAPGPPPSVVLAMLLPSVPHPSSEVRKDTLAGAASVRSCQVAPPSVVRQRLVPCWTQARGRILGLDPAQVAREGALLGPGRAAVGAAPERGVGGQPAVRGRAEADGGYGNIPEVTGRQVSVQVWPASRVLARRIAVGGHHRSFPSTQPRAWSKKSSVSML